jgi:hypothetical protein
MTELIWVERLGRLFGNAKDKLLDLLTCMGGACSGFLQNLLGADNGDETVRMESSYREIC